MILLDVTCYAREHDTARARRRGCVCPKPDPQSQPKPARNLSPEMRANLRGPRSTVGWDDLDEIAVERAVMGERPAVMAAVERWAAIDRLDRYGLSARQIAARLGTTSRAVTRRRRARRLSA